ncbi:CDAN1-interacting nuclease 1 isoform X1 [Neodiprion virginianus]|uniref:CDAN1-interacting nuclease 1 isoform X1 n=2 Tax=Neodiprion virginianus TaxID=2961670 RepID=UPI001EE76DB9|nr:CDAN1-interacting nuclease 1 isoform X1 [Neodiprion virginianus]XP_046617527.1 CDAN1-interacting nuclease 1 isoform X1 [Neodiprion virginianus]XP_046617528.1 CDAN1-interacting nuclease 1 isoform X1 [Neodiprion virginianus]XP_046617529.1 CDAN1-interacting nuclease 1 isoform X1 [Neodiprion virginianus]XP_046617530.1 CDAN1-interacting nuclease 1 isoform X1 [Neodiprion virginianus]XP_046617531.1 CDAN1-interacting nuclease 1 isoform X1 [Neodiprion virginianus]
MKQEIYENIMTSIKQFKGMSKDCDKMLRETFPHIPPDTLSSILALEIRRRMKFSHAKLCSQGTEYYERYTEAISNGESIGVLVRMSEETGLSPALLARIILENHCEQNKLTTSRSEITKLLRDTTLIEDKDLAYEIYLYFSLYFQCIIYDDQYGPISDAVKHSIGQEYEVKLQNYVSERNIAFLNEDHLRLRGYDKTPDIKLEVPVAVNGFVINWIESKALFGNEDVHKKYIKEQFLSYWNRFGPGLVIYWFGFLDTLNQPNEKKFIIMDHFPENITYMDPKSVKSLSL